MNKHTQKTKVEFLEGVIDAFAEATGCEKPQRRPTKTPWHVYYGNKFGPNERSIIATTDGKNTEESQANAARIVHCVNHFDELVEALEELLRADERPPTEENLELAVDAMHKARAVLEKVKK